MRTRQRAVIGSLRPGHVCKMAAVAFLLAGGMLDSGAKGDWPMLRQGTAHTGLVESEIRPPYHLVWSRHFEGERLGTAMEPIVAGGQVLAGTHQGRIYALDVNSGDARWVFQANGPFLHSPAVAEGKVLAACADGNLYALEAKTGKIEWIFQGERGGFSAAPVSESGRVYLGSRAGDMLAIRIGDGELVWRQALGVPIRQTAALADDRVMVTGEDLRVRGFDARDGKLLWTSEPLPGQTARDYYPIIINQKGRPWVVVRTNPLLNMGQRIGRDRTLLCRQAGIDDSSWQKVDAWIKSNQARGNSKLWTQEQRAIQEYLETHREAQSFFVLDGQTGREVRTAPILWIAGCQAVGVQPALTAEGRLLVFYRSAYGNWNHGVAPLVALGLLDLERNQIAPLFHQQGKQPSWNCFWGTADESQNFLVVGNTLLIVHQGTLSGFDLEKNELFPIWGERDTYGGFRNPPWARNEWHGPARSGVAVDGERIYWQTGSRLLCLAPGAPAQPGHSYQPAAVPPPVPSATAPPPALTGPTKLRQQLASLVDEIISTHWAPLFVDPGLAGRDFSFDNSGDIFEALAWAYPHLDSSRQVKVKERLREEWRRHPPFARQGWYSLSEGARREWFSVPIEYCARLGNDPQPHPFGNMSALWLYAKRCGEEPLVIEQWPQLKAAYADFEASGWKLGEKGHLFANRYLASLLAFGEIARQCGKADLAGQAQVKADQTAEALAAWWRRAADQGTLQSFQSSSELDPFIGKGDGISLAVAPHRHQMALFKDLTPEVAALVRAKAPQAASQVWRIFEAMCPTWPLQGEERQIHYGENFVDPPGLAMDAFRALAWLQAAAGPDLERAVDLPFCRADLYYLTKLALTLETLGRRLP